MEICIKFMIVLIVANSLTIVQYVDDFRLFIFSRILGAKEKKENITFKMQVEYYIELCIF